jgi:hypothetical protein
MIMGASETICSGGPDSKFWNRRGVRTASLSSSGYPLSRDLRPCDRVGGDRLFGAEFSNELPECLRHFRQVAIV